MLRIKIELIVDVPFLETPEEAKVYADNLKVNEESVDELIDNNDTKITVYTVDEDGNELDTDEIEYSEDEDEDDEDFEDDDD